MISRLAANISLLLVLWLLASPSPGWSLGPAWGGFVPFDRELYELGHRIFLANGNLADALRLSEAALLSRPDDALWRARAARISEWRGEPQRALTHWFHLATVNRDREAQANALRLAEATGDFPGQKILLKQSLLGKAEPETLKRYLRVCQVLGETEEAIDLLEKKRESELKSISLVQLPKLYAAAGDPDKAIQALTLQAREAPAVETLLELARLQFSRGNPQGAYLTLKEGQGSPQAADPAYLEVLSDLCWMMQDTACAAAASKQLLGQGTGREVDSRRLFLSAWKTDPELAFATGVEGWRRFEKFDFLRMAANLGQSRGDWAELEELLRGMSPEQQARLDSSSDYWLLRSKVYRQLGRDQVALADFRKAMGVEPGNRQLVADYIWLLLDLDVHDSLQTIAGRWLELSGAPPLADAMGSAYAHLGDYRQSLWLYRSRFAAHRDDPAWLAAYAQLLEQNGLEGAAAMARLQGGEQVRDRLSNLVPGSAEHLEELNNYATLSLETQQGDRLDGAMRQIVQGDEKGEATELIAAWAMATDRHEAARLWLRRSLGPTARPSAGVQLRLALAENDLPQISALLEGNPWRLPYRDAVAGARRTGALPLSEELAWQRSWQNPDDQLLFQQLQEVLDRHPSRVGYRMRLLDRAGVGGVENRFEASQPITRSLSLLAEVGQTRNDPLETGAIGSLPSRDLLARVGLATVLEQGQAALAAGWRSAMEEFPFFEASGTYSPSRRLALGWELQYSSPADETVPLALGGVKDQAALTLTLTPTARDALQLRFTQALLRDQSRRRLGEGGTYTLDLAHKLTFAYPDVALRIFGGYHDYSRRGEPRGKILTLLPAGVVGSAAFFVPDSFGQVGAGFSFGQGFRERYSQSWKPFGRAELFWRSNTDSGFLYEFGLQGPVFGYDALSLALLQESGAFNSSDMSTTLQLGYGYFLN